MWRQLQCPWIAGYTQSTPGLDCGRPKHSRTAKLKSGGVPAQISPGSRRRTSRAPKVSEPVSGRGRAAPCPAAESRRQLPVNPSGASGGGSRKTMCINRFGFPAGQCVCVVRDVRPACLPGNGAKIRPRLVAHGRRATGLATSHYARDRTTDPKLVEDSSERLMDIRYSPAFTTVRRCPRRIDPMHSRHLAGEPVCGLILRLPEGTVTLIH